MKENRRKERGCRWGQNEGEREKGAIWVKRGNEGGIQRHRQTGTETEEQRDRERRTQTNLACILACIATTKSKCATVIKVHGEILPIALSVRGALAIVLPTESARSHANTVIRRVRPLCRFSPVDARVFIAFYGCASFCRKISCVW